MHLFVFLYGTTHQLCHMMFREEVWDWLFKAAIKWKLLHERPRNSFCEAAIISELVSTTNSTSDFFHMWNIQSLESHCIKQDLIQAHISIFSGSEAWQIMWMALLGDLCRGTNQVADHKGQVQSALSEQHWNLDRLKRSNCKTRKGLTPL